MPQLGGVFAVALCVHQHKSILLVVLNHLCNTAEPLKEELRDLDISEKYRIEKHKTESFP